MKKSVRSLLVCLVLVACVFTITACGKANLKDAAGTYTGKYTKLVGDDFENRTTDEEFSLELKEDGTGTHNRDGASYKVEWKLDGESFTMKETFLGISIDYNGTLKDGKLDIFNGDSKDIFTMEYVYEK